MLLLSLALTLGGCTEDKEEPTKDAPAAAAEVKTKDATGTETATPAQTESAQDAGSDERADTRADTQEAGAAEDGTAEDAASPAKTEDGDAKATAAGTAEPAEADVPGEAMDAAAAGENGGESSEEETAENAEQASEEGANDGSEEGSGAAVPQKSDDELTEEEKLEAAKALWPPVEELVTAPFGEHRGSIVPLLSDAPMKSRSHSGLDLRGHLGWPVRSLEDGKVVSAGPGGNAGIMVKIEQTDGKSVAYAHLGEVLVKSGDEVKKGQHIGKVGCTGRTTGAHLHITVRDEKGNLLNPEEEIEGMWEVYDPPLADLREPINAQSCGRVYGGVNRRLQGQKQYLRMRKALLGNEYKVPDAIPSWGSSQK